MAVGVGSGIGVEIGVCVTAGTDSSGWLCGGSVLLQPVKTETVITTDNNSAVNL